MKKLYYTITTLEPLIITQHSDDPNMYETLQYIRGTIIQGVFAQYYLKNKTADSEFTRIIVKGDCIFSNAYPVYGNKTFLPAPFSMIREKYAPEKVHDLLVSSTNEQTKGIASLISIDGNEVHSITIPKDIRLHNQIDDNKRVTEKGILFNYQSLPVGLVFKGHLTIKKDTDEAILKGVISDDTKIRMGRSATSEYGKVCFNWVIDDSNVEEEFEDKVIMTLLSDTIIFNEMGFSSSNFKDLNQYLEGISIKAERKELVDSIERIFPNVISRKSRIEGFLNIWRLRKPSENVFAAGSAFILDKLPENAEALLNFGLGERTHEGYGQISLSKPTVVDEVFFFDKPTEFIDNSFSQTIMPGLTIKILQAAYLAREKSIITGKALIDAEETKNIPKNHLIGKLKGMAEDIATFRDNIKILREPAKRQLKKAHIRNRTLEEHLIYIASHIESIYTLIHTIETNNVDLTVFKTELTRHYFVQYFKQLRRENKKN